MKIGGLFKTMVLLPLLFYFKENDQNLNSIIILQFYLQNKCTEMCCTVQKYNGCFRNTDIIF